MATFHRVQEIEHEIGPDGRFSLRVTSSDVRIRAIDGAVARVRVEFELGAPSDNEADDLFERVRFRVLQGSGSLEVSEPRRNDGIAGIVRMLGIGGGRVEAAVLAEVPRAAHVSYAGVSADAVVGGLGGPQEYKTVSGDLVINESAGPIRISGVSSDVTLRAESAISLKANTVSGDVSVIAPRIDELRAVTVSGDVELEGELASGLEHRVETVSGDLGIGAVGGLTLEVRGLSSDVSISVPHRSEGSRDRRRYVIGDGGADLLFSSMSGDVSVGGARRVSPPAPSHPPAPPAPPESPRRPLSPEAQMDILRALERGEIDVEEANRRLAGEEPRDA